MENLKEDFRTPHHLEFGDYFSLSASTGRVYLLEAETADQPCGQHVCFVGSDDKKVFTSTLLQEKLLRVYKQISFETPLTCSRKGCG